MKDNRKLKLDELLQEVSHLKEENQSLRLENDFLEKELIHYKSKSVSLAQRCRDLSTENQKLAVKAKDKEFSEKLFGNDFLKAELAAEKHEAELVNAMGSYLGDDY